MKQLIFILMLLIAGQGHGEDCALRIFSHCCPQLNDLKAIGLFMTGPKGSEDFKYPDLTVTTSCLMQYADCPNTQDAVDLMCVDNLIPPDHNISAYCRDDYYEGFGKEVFIECSVGWFPLRWFDFDKDGDDDVDLKDYAFLQNQFGQ